MKKLQIIAGSTLLLTLFIIGGCNFMLRFPSDEEMMRTFASSQADFSALLNMSNEDNRYYRIAPGFTHPEAGSVPVIEGERWNDYKNRFAKLGLADGIARYHDGSSSVLFIAKSRGLLNGGRSKGYAYLTKEPSPLLPGLNDDDTDAFYRSHANLRNAFLYRRIKKNWYLFFG